MYNQDNEIITIIDSLKKNKLYPAISNFTNLNKDITIKLDNILYDLIQVVKILRVHSIDYSGILSLQSRIKNIIKQRGYNISAKELQKELDEVVWTLNSLKSSKTIEEIGHGLETTVRGIPTYYLRDKVVKRLFETTDKKIVDNYLLRVHAYCNKMNALHHKFMLWPTETKVIKKDIMIGDKISALYVVYSIQKRFNPGFTLNNVLGAADEKTFLEMFGTMTEIALKIIQSNMSGNIKTVGDLDCANVLYIGSTFYYFDYNNPFLKIGNENYREMKMIWDLMKKGSKFSFLTKGAFFTVVKNMFVPENIVQKIFLSFIFASRRWSKDLKEKMWVILINKTDQIPTGINIRKIKISKPIFIFKYGGLIADYIPFLQKKD